MTNEIIEKIADAVLYEGYMLYPYRASAIKNRQRFNFGVLAPPAYSAAQRGTENFQMETQCLISDTEQPRLDLKVRFLQLREREIYRVNEVAEFSLADSLDLDGTIYLPWQEALEREVDIADLDVRTLAKQPRRIEFSFPENSESEILLDADQITAGAIVRKQSAIQGDVEIAAEHLRENLYKLTVRVSNATPFGNAGERSRDEALASSLVSAHMIMRAKEGAFISLLDPPAEYAEAVSLCHNQATFPVLVGETGKRDAMLSSPIILYDYPEIASESAGELFDGTEIDEILTLRIMTMTDDEKREMRNIDERARKILERTEIMPQEELMKLHGVLRRPRALMKEA
jgi:hypothetical protein